MDDYRWVNRIFWAGYKRELDLDDIFEPLEEHKSSRLARFDLAALYLILGSIAPIEVLLCCIVMWVKMGSSVMVGVMTAHNEPKGQPPITRTDSLEQLKKNNGTTKRNSLIIGVTQFARDIDEPGVNLDKATAYWSRDSGDPSLSDVTLNLRPGNLVIVIGTVGAGKTSLIQAVLGELPLLSGSRNVKGQLSYAAQEPWLFSGTIRQNVTFGSPWDPVRYKEVVRACALERDFSLMPHGDLTQVGERGVTLSGAVDANVARHLMEECIIGLLRTKCVLLATHQLQFLQCASHVIVLDNVTPRVAEMRSLGSVSGSVYSQYLKSAGSFLQVFLVFSMFLLTQLAASGTDIWVAHW
ncbi:hypothetical protein B566_EDAN011858 [Ephemera danica]|nr:hypothetical protein B566_EDAN011858 [Ephemera danica]